MKRVFMGVWAKQTLDTLLLKGNNVVTVTRKTLMRNKKEYLLIVFFYFILYGLFVLLVMLNLYGIVACTHDHTV